MKNIILCCMLLVLVSCNTKTTTPKEGTWRAMLDVNDGKELPFLIEYNKDTTLVFINAEERIDIDDVQLLGDSIIIKHPIYEGVFKGVFSEDKITGNFIKPSLKRTVPFSMEYNKLNRFPISETATINITGSWETMFSPKSEEDRYIAKGVFEQEGNKVTGTFRTTTGDYRYLDGVMDGDVLKLSTFDGAHAFLFEAQVTDNVMNGFFYSGNHWKEPFTAKRNEAYQLPNEESLTFLKEGYDAFEFAFPDTQGNLVSLKDEQFKDKVVIVQIMGTWCPNCLDETKYYTQYHNTHKSDDLAFVSLAFEYAPTKEKAINAINRLKKALGVPYPVLLAQYGTSSKIKANEKLPMLNHILSYPTTIFIDKKGEVRKIHTGFNGPATGKKYKTFTVDFESFVIMLQEETDANS